MPKDIPTVLFINQHFGFLARDLANGFSKNLGLTRVVCGNPEDVDLDESIQIIKRTAYNRNSLGKRFISWIRFSLENYWTIGKNSGQIWILVTNPPLIPLILGNRAQKTNTPFFIILYDLYPDALKSIAFFKQDSLLFKLWGQWNQRIFSKATGIITLSESMKNGLRTYLPDYPEALIQVIPNWFDKPVHASSEPNKFQSQYPGKKIVLYSGNIGLTHDLETIIEAAKILKEEDNFQFVFAGEGGKKSKLMGMTNSYGLENIDFLPYQSPQDFQSLLEASDFAIVSTAEGIESSSVPSKTYNALFSGLYIIGISPKGSGLEALIHEFKVGKNFLPGDVESIVLTLKELLINPQKLSAFQVESKKVSENFSSKNVDLYIDFIKKSLDKIEKNPKIKL